MTSTKCKICVSIAGKSRRDILESAEQAEPLADVLEIRLDGIDKPEIKPFLQGLNKPVLFTNRAKWEGGNFAGEETARLQPLYEAIKCGADYIDIELKTAADLRQEIIKAAKGKCKTIVSWHNFTVTPSKQALESILMEQYRSTADIGKIVTMANCFDDVLRVMNLQHQAAEMGLPLIAFCMGRAGAISRVATIELGGFMTYASLNKNQATAPGQLSAQSIRNILQELPDED